MSLCPAVHTVSFDRGDEYRGLEPHPPQQVAEPFQLEVIEPVRDFREARTVWMVGLSVGVATPSTISTS
jgi:hypothetical protein